MGASLAALAAVTLLALTIWPRGGTLHGPRPGAEYVEAQLRGLEVAAIVTHVEGLPAAKGQTPLAPGMRLNGGPLAYASTRPPDPLTIEEEAALAFAACGVTGPVLAELPYTSGDMPEAGGGNIMRQFTGRTVASGDVSREPKEKEAAQ